MEEIFKNADKAINDFWGVCDTFVQKVKEKQQIPEDLNWHHEELIEKMPYTQAKMIHALVNGDFIVEGKQSGIEDAILFADMLAEQKKDTPHLWNALDHYSLTQ